MIVSLSWNPLRAATFADLDKLAAYLEKKKSVGRYVVCLEHFGQGRKQHLQCYYDSTQTRLDNISGAKKKGQLCFDLKYVPGKPETFMHEFKLRDVDPEGLFGFGYCFKEVRDEQGIFEKALIRTNIPEEEWTRYYDYHADNCKKLVVKRVNGTFYEKVSDYIYDNLHSIIGFDRLVRWRDVEMAEMVAAEERRWVFRCYDEVIFDYFVENGPSAIPFHQMTNMRKTYVAIVYFNVRKWISDTFE